MPKSTQILEVGDYIIWVSDFSGHGDGWIDMYGERFEITEKVDDTKFLAFNDRLGYSTEIYTDDHFYIVG